MKCYVEERGEDEIVLHLSEKMSLNHKSAICSGLVRIEGVEAVAFDPDRSYKLGIEKGRMFSWDLDILPKAEEVLREQLDPEGSIVRISSL
ncbi:MAG: hypothetical protein GXP44_01545 [bacterium]|nr:hypothetical protein [bacterium]